MQLLSLLIKDEIIVKMPVIVSKDPRYCIQQSKTKNILFSLRHGEEKTKILTFEKQQTSEFLSFFKKELN